MLCGVKNWFPELIALIFSSLEICITKKVSYKEINSTFLISKTRKGNKCIESRFIDGNYYVFLSKYRRNYNWTEILFTVQARLIAPKQDSIPTVKQSRKGF